MEDKRNEEIKELKEKYPLSFKRWLAREIESGTISAKEALDRFSINRDIKTVYYWVQLYGLGKELSLSIMTPEEKLDKALLEKRIKALEKALEMANLKNVAIETMIDIAEEQFKISIRKKAGPKQ